MAKGFCYFSVNTHYNKVSFSGLDQPDADLIQWFNGTMVVKVPGHSYWRGLNMERGYTPASIEVWRVIELKDPRDGDTKYTVRGRAKQLTSYPSRLKDDPLCRPSTITDSVTGENRTWDPETKQPMK